MKIKSFKPMLAPNDKVDLSNVNYPILASTKLDGIRCIFKNGHMLSRSLKEIANKQLQEKYQYLKDYTKTRNVVLDGELYGQGMTFQQITHFVMTEDLGDEESLPKELMFYCFDYLCMDSSLCYDMVFVDRYRCLKDLGHVLGDKVFIVKQKLMNNKNEVEEYFGEVVKDGFEGLILKSTLGKYKFGRATLKSGDMYKVKPFITIDGQIIDVEERFENTAESFTNELGRTQRHNFKEDKKHTGIAATFVVKYKGQEQKVCLTGTEEFRTEIWTNRKKYIGKFCEYKAMEVGQKEGGLLRHPTFIRMRIDKE